MARLDEARSAGVPDEERRNGEYELIGQPGEQELR